MLTGKPINYFMSPYSYFSLSSKRSEVICAKMTKKRVFWDSDVPKNVLKFEFFSVLKIKISCAQACTSCIVVATAAAAAATTTV